MKNKSNSKKFKYDFSHHFKNILKENTTVQELMLFFKEWEDEKGKSEQHIVYSCDDWQFYFMFKLVDKFQERLEEKTIFKNVELSKEYIVKEFYFLNYTLYEFMGSKILLVNTPRNYILKFNN